MAAAGVDALIAPKAFKSKDKDPETLLIDFDLYIKTINNFFIATGRDDATNKQKVALLQAVGGPDMVDVVEEIGKVVLVGIAADDANNVVAVAADTYEQAIEKIRNGIVGKTNQAMSRLKLFQQMGQGSQKFGAWQKEVYKQAKRCTWTNYGIQDAARDAILYQTTDQRLRKRILANNLSYEDTVTWGQSNEEATRKAQLVEETTGRSEDKVRRLEEKLTKLQSQQRTAHRCQTCSRPRHSPEQPCPGIKCPECHACKQSGHFIGAPICPGPSKENKAGTAKARVKVKKVGSSITRDESEEEESDTDTIGWIKSITSSTDVEVKMGIRPRTCLKQTWIRWTADSGVKRTLLSETGWKLIERRTRLTQSPT